MNGGGRRKRERWRREVKRPALALRLHPVFPVIDAAVTN